MVVFQHNKIHYFEALCRKTMNGNDIKKQPNCR